MKKILTIMVTALSALVLVACSNGGGQTSSNNSNNRTTSSTFNGNSKVLFINASQNKDGNTVKLGNQLLEDVEYDQLNLVDYQINQLGQNKEGDQFEDVLSAIENADTIVIGTPVYWHSMSGSLKTLIDRFYELQGSNRDLSGKKLYFFMQGSAPTEQAISSTEYIIERVAQLLQMDLVGMADNDSEITQLHQELVK